MEAVDTFTIDRNGREYAVAVYVDDAPSNPRADQDNPATQFYVTQYTYGRWDTYVDELDGIAGAALAHFIERYGAANGDDVERAYGKWRAITGSPVVLVTGQSNGHSQGDWHYWFALVDTDVLARDGYGATAQELAKIEADEYAAYAYGDVYGIVVSLAGEPVDIPLWGIVDRDGDYIREVAADMVDAHERMLAEQSQKAGAGFVGVL